MNEKNIEELVSEFNKILESKGFKSWAIRKITFEEKVNAKRNNPEYCRWKEIPPNSGHWEEICT